jgi:hypothetical protein
MIPRPYVIDVVDVSDQGGLYWKYCLEGHNTVTIAIGGMSNSIEKMINMVLEATGGKPVIRCLAFWGHGLLKDDKPVGIHLIAGGWQADHGRDSRGEFPSRGSFSKANISTMHESLMRLKLCFASDARVELRGCGVAATTEGIEAMKMLATQWRVRVQGAKKDQPTMSWLPPLVEVSPSGVPCEGVPGTEYNLRT